MIEKGAFDTYVPITIQSVNYKNWRTAFDLRTCLECLSLHGKIYDINEWVLTTRRRSHMVRGRYKLL